ncbi:Hsp20/alpha crystallin family protein [Cyclobacterium plantarum]|uniref:Hsp20/alpha crystallin family protein n=1 Tax=Cyclobacterium plantarum TaxID=2716263 RepID=A0ABX0H7B5_9BACT|nr:Hsp20/alpha crystallin family protein [Cyclobacterium plantarum]NHE56268.1 Hsp20/alpha crystallin family protein [Cyclobacterium plantarum]
MENVISKNGRKQRPQFFEDMLSRELLGLNKTNWNTAYVPMVNIIETNEDYRIQVGLPGMEREDIKVELDNQVITVSGNMDQHQQRDSEGNQYVLREFNYHSFSRSFQLPDTVNAEGIDASFNQGMLTLFLPKRDEAKRRPIKIIDIS